MVTESRDRALPIKVDPTSNGEFRPVPLTKPLTQANVLARERISAHAKHFGVGRRAFLQSLCAAATTLGTFNEAFAAQGNTGGSFRLPKEAVYESAAARSALAGDEFIFDVQTHLVDPAGAWRANAGKYWEQILAHFPHGACGERDPVDCFSADQFIKHVFMDSDTSIAVLSFVPELPERNPLSLREAERVRVLVERMGGAKRLFLHAMVVPNARAIDPLQFMEEAVARYPIKAWKSYTQWGPEGVGWELDDPAVGIPFIEKARALGVRTICIHKGLFFSGFPERYGRCADVGRAAKLYPDVNFIIYHSGFETGHRESPFDPVRATHGVDTLIKSLLDNGIAPNSNVYAELGSTWRFAMRDPTMAAHLLGKLLVHVGQDNVLWGTDSIWYGSPQDQIQAFRSFEIAPKLLEAHHYPELTPRLKAKIFCLNGARVYGVDIPVERKKTEADPIGVRKQTYRRFSRPSDPGPTASSRRSWSSVKGCQYSTPLLAIVGKAHRRGNLYPTKSRIAATNARERVRRIRTHAALLWVQQVRAARRPVPRDGRSRRSRLTVESIDPRCRRYPHSRAPAATRCRARFHHIRMVALRKPVTRRGIEP